MSQSPKTTIYAILKPIGVDNQTFIEKMFDESNEEAFVELPNGFYMVIGRDDESAAYTGVYADGEICLYDHITYDWGDTVSIDYVLGKNEALYEWCEINQHIYGFRYEIHIGSGFG